jgi:glyoxylase-like metal-dependent hydrolase (beta-lactamase superfamily II)
MSLHMSATGMPATGDIARDGPGEIAPGVHYLAVGKGLMRSNVYFVRSGTSWALIDAGSVKCGRAILDAAASLFGEESPPVAILLTHDHPDHAGSARELAKAWDCPVWVHPDELPLSLGDISAIHAYANPLDRWMVLPMMRLMGSKRAEAMVSAASLKGVSRPFDPSTGVPGLPDWEAVHTPGHTPGHVAFFRGEDRVLITGDALVTINLNSALSLVWKKPVVAAPPWYVTWDRPMAKRSVALLAELEPQVVAGGHGIPMAGPETPERVRALSNRV